MTKATIINDLRKLNPTELTAKIREAKLHAQSQVSALAVGKLKNVQEIRRQRKYTAQLLTVLNEKIMLQEVTNAN